MTKQKRLGRGLAALLGGPIDEQPAFADTPAKVEEPTLPRVYRGEEETSCDQQDPNGSARWNQLVEARAYVEGLVGDEPAIFGGDFSGGIGVRVISSCHRSEISRFVGYPP